MLLKVTRKGLFLEPEQRAKFSSLTYQLAEQYHVGLPLALYNMQPQWIRIFQVLRRVLLGVVIGTVLFLLIVVVLFSYQYLVVFAGQIPDLHARLLLSLPGTVNGLLGCIACMIFRNIIAQQVPASFLVCTEGALKIYPKQVDVTRWDEVKEPLQGPGLGKKKRYDLYRINRKPLFFGENFEDVEGLANLVRQQIEMNAKNL